MNNIVEIGGYNIDLSNIKAISGDGNEDYGTIEILLLRWHERIPENPEYVDMIMIKPKLEIEFRNEEAMKRNKQKLLIAWDKYIETNNKNT